MQRAACARRSGAGAYLGPGLNRRGMSRPKAFISFEIVFIAREHFSLGSGRDFYTQSVHMHSPYPIIQCQTQAPLPWVINYFLVSNLVLNSLQAELELG